jgi:acetyl esterase/lipase
MRLFIATIAALIISLPAAGANAQPSRQQFTLPTPGGRILVDGGFPDNYSQPVRPLPPLLLIWGSADEIFPLSIGRALQKTAQLLGMPVTLNVYDGEPHDFFLRSGTGNADAAHKSAAEFLAARLSRNS